MNAGRPIGLHLQTRPDLLRAADRAVAIGVNAVQLFADNPASWRRRPDLPATLPEFLHRLRAGAVSTVAVHGPYLLNLASPDPTIRARTIETVAHELRVAAAYGATAVNVHLGSHVGSGMSAGVKRIGTAVSEALDAASVGSGDAALPPLVLENSAGGGDGIGGSLEELAAVLDSVASAGADASGIAFCLDTAHLWGAGYDIRDIEGVDAVLTRFDALLGLDRLALVHLNDSRAGLGSHLDRHEHVGAGAIGPPGMAAVLADARLVRVPMFVETEPEGGLDAANQERIRYLLAGELDLPPLPQPPPARPRTRHGAASTRPRRGASEPARARRTSPGSRARRGTSGL